jgi:hypothetical protein
MPKITSGRITSGTGRVSFGGENATGIDMVATEEIVQLDMGPVDTTALVGPMGPPGAPGANGTQGPAGATGSQGPRGPLGATGLPGVDGATGGTGPTSPQNMTGYFPGIVVAQVGTQRIYPRSTVIVTSVSAWLSGNPTVTVSAAIRKNGTVEQTITVPPSVTKTTTVTNIIVTPDDYLTIDVLSGTGRDLTVRLEF